MSAVSEQELQHLRLAGQWRMVRDLAGRKVCLTGKMSMERAALAVLIEAAGGRFTNTMSGAVDVLVTADGGTWTTKVRAAEAAGTTVMRETEFVAALMATPEELVSGRREQFGAER